MGKKVFFRVAILVTTGLCIALVKTFPTQDGHLEMTQESSMKSDDCNVLFRSDFINTPISKVFGRSLGYGLANIKVLNATNEIEVKYPKGSHVPFPGNIYGGFGVFTKHPVESDRTVIFKYSVYFPEGFQFVLGGKLPGLHGGKMGCTGGNRATNCFSTRMMWREEGRGELYLYANREAQHPQICKTEGNFCDPVYGWSLGQGSFLFRPGTWTSIEQILTLNEPGKMNGVIDIKVNGRRAIYYDNIVFRTAAYPDMRVEGMDLETFFGGNGPRFASPTNQTAKFKDFSLESCAVRNGELVEFNR